MGEFSGTRLYLGNLPRDVTKREVEDFFKEHGNGDIVEVKLMNGFGFIQYGNEEDPKDIVPAYHGREFKGQRLTVQFARGNRHAPRDNYAAPDSRYPRTRRTNNRMAVTGLSPDTSWQDLKDFARKSGVDVVFSEVSRDGRGVVEFETYEDLREAISKLDDTEFKGSRVHCTADESGASFPANGGGGGGGRGGRFRSRSPGVRRYSPPAQRAGYSPRRRDYSPRRDYRDRSPRRDAYHHSDRRDPRDHETYPPKGRYDDDSHTPYANGGSRRGPPPADDLPPARGRPLSPRGGRSTPPRFRGSNSNSGAAPARPSRRH